MIKEGNPIFNRNVREGYFEAGKRMVILLKTGPGENLANQRNARQDACERQ